MNTETNETIRGWVCYDAECAFCRAWARRGHGLLARRGYHLAPLQAPWVRERLGLAAGDPLVEMKLLTADGGVCGGADALIHLCRSIWWAWPVYILALIPGVKPLMRASYRVMARNRHCLAVGCPADSVNRPVAGCRHPHCAFFELP